MAEKLHVRKAPSEMDDDSLIIHLKYSHPGATGASMRREDVMAAHERAHAEGATHGHEDDGRPVPLTTMDFRPME